MTALDDLLQQFHANRLTHTAMDVSSGSGAAYNLVGTRREGHATDPGAGVPGPGELTHKGEAADGAGDEIRCTDHVTRRDNRASGIEHAVAGQAGTAPLQSTPFGRYRDFDRLAAHQANTVESDCHIQTLVGRR